MCSNTVLGNLIADILTPGLHAELSKTASEERRPGEPGPQGSYGEDEESES